MQHLPGNLFPVLGSFLMEEKEKLFGKLLGQHSLPAGNIHHQTIMFLPIESQRRIKNDNRNNTEEKDDKTGKLLLDT